MDVCAKCPVLTLCVCVRLQASPKAPLVSIIMGSDSDLPVMKGAGKLPIPPLVV